VDSGDPGSHRQAVVAANGCAASERMSLLVGKSTTASGRLRRFLDTTSVPGPGSVCPHAPLRDAGPARTAEHADV